MTQTAAAEAPQAEPAMQGKTVLVTGASSGIGLETTRGLAAQGARVVMLVRNAGKGDAAMTEVRRTVPDAKLELVLADLYTMSEVRRAATEIKQRYPRLDVLVNNAGLIHTGRELTADGLERTFALNHLAAFLLTYELRDLLAASAPARVVTVSSMAHKFASIDWDDLPYRAKGYSETWVYGTSKLCNIWFAVESARRFAGKGVTSNALHPGAVASNFGASGSWVYRVGTKIVRPFLINTVKGARTSIYLASSSEVDGVTGKYFFRCREKTPSKHARDDAEAAKLWELSEKLCGLTWS